MSRWAGLESSTSKERELQWNGLTDNGIWKEVGHSRVWGDLDVR